MRKQQREITNHQREIQNNTINYVKEISLSHVIKTINHHYLLMLFILIMQIILLLQNNAILLRLESSKKHRQDIFSFLAYKTLRSIVRPFFSRILSNHLFFGEKIFLPNCIYKACHIYVCYSL